MLNRRNAASSSHSIRKYRHKQMKTCNIYPIITKLQNNLNVCSIHHSRKLSSVVSSASSTASISDSGSASTTFSTPFDANAKRTSVSITAARSASFCKRSTTFVLPQYLKPRLTPRPCHRPRPMRPRYLKPRPTYRWFPKLRPVNRRPSRRYRPVSPPCLKPYPVPRLCPRPLPLHRLCRKPLPTRV